MKLISVGVPETSPHAKGLVITTSELEVVYEYEGVVRTAVVPKGYVSNGASIPSLLWPIVGSPFLPEFMAAALIHDMMCDGGHSIDEMSLLFEEVLLHNEVHWFKAAAMEKAVRLFTKLVVS